MRDSWKYAQKLLFPQSDLCECGHQRKDHDNMRGYCLRCETEGVVNDITSTLPDGVLSDLLGKYEKCEKFRHWSIERVRDFWAFVNITLEFCTNTSQTILDDYF